jgi:hypothetical protein
MKILSACLSLLLVASIAGGQEASTNSIGGEAPTVVAGANRPQDFGVGPQQAYTVTANAMTPLVSDTTYNYSGGGIARYRTGGSFWFQGQVVVPTGALLTGFEVDGCDTSATATIDAFLHRCPTGGGACATLASVSSGGAPTPGCTFFFSGIANHTVNQLAASYDVEVALTGTDQSTRFQAVRVYWQRQLSPAPQSPTFGDVPTDHPFFRVIEALNTSGITSGCGSGNFCPEDVVKRKDFAKFLARALGLAYNDNFLF